MPQYTFRPMHVKSIYRGDVVLRVVEQQKNTAILQCNDFEFLDVARTSKTFAEELTARGIQKLVIDVTNAGYGGKKTPDSIGFLLDYHLGERVGDPFQKMYVGTNEGYQRDIVGIGLTKIFEGKTAKNIDEAIERLQQ